MAVKANSSTSSFRVILDTYKKLILFISLFMAICFFVGLAMLSAYRNPARLATPSDKYPISEIVVIGSSQAQYAYNPLVLESYSGMRAVNLGAKGAQPDSAYYLLLDSLSFNTPQVVILDVYWRTLEGNLDFSQLRRTWESIVDEKVRKTMYKESFPVKSKIDYAIPVLRYRQELYASMEEFASFMVGRGIPSDDDELQDTAGVEKTDYRGHRHASKTVSTRVLTEENKLRFARSRDFGTRQLDYLKNIMDLCREKGITVYAVSAPLPPESLAFVKDYRNIHDRLMKFFTAMDVEYLDFNMENAEGGIVDGRYFMDENHMNGEGADIFTRQLAGRLFPVKLPSATSD